MEALKKIFWTPSGPRAASFSLPERWLGTLSGLVGLILLAFGGGGRYEGA